MRASIVRTSYCFADTSVLHKNSEQLGNMQDVFLTIVLETGGIECRSLKAVIMRKERWYTAIQFKWIAAHTI